MKKLLSVIFVVMMLFTLTACGSDSPYVGVWNATEYETMGVTISPDELGESSLTLDAGGDLTANFMGTEGYGTWEETETGIHISSDVELDCESDGKTLTLEYSGVKITFEKEAAADENAENGDDAEAVSEDESGVSDQNEKNSKDKKDKNADAVNEENQETEE
ncbi:MAG: lipoprotein [Bacillota bacterium]|jgi:hypothetical protein